MYLYSENTLPMLKFMGCKISTMVLSLIAFANYVLRVGYTSHEWVTRVLTSLTHFRLPML